MTRSSLGFIAQAAELHQRQTPRLDARELRRYVQSFLDRRDIFLAAVRVEGSPLYAIDRETLIDRAQRFRDAFSSCIPDLRVYYALKSNSHPLIANSLIAEGIGLDVSSGLELKAAIDYGAKEIVFSGPGKLREELELAAAYPDRVTVLLDSFGELNRLEQVAERTQTTLRAGVRLTTEDSGIWRKFGIPLSRLAEFFDRAEQCRQIDLSGLQFHLSWNLNPESQVLFIARLGAELRQLDPKYRRRIKFVDIGGGFWPEVGEWLQPAATPRGMIQAALGDDTTGGGLEHYKHAACSIDEFAQHISTALKNRLPEDMHYTVCLEPGRWLCHSAMHILLTVVDVKSDEVVITDGGTNAVGWERFETDFFPVINLTRPGHHEHECLVAGSLCTPHDLWGYSYSGDRIREGDILLIPDQGAYTYSLRQEFIKPLPRSVELSEKGNHRAASPASGSKGTINNHGNPNPSSIEPSC